MSDVFDDADRQILTALRDSVDVSDRSTPVEAVLSRGAELRHRRRVTRGLVGTSLAVMLASAVAIGPWPARVPDPDGVTATSSARPINVELVGWSVRTNPDSTLTITLRDPHLFDFDHPQLVDADRLRAILASVGVPVVLEFHDLTAVQGVTNINCHEGPVELALTEKVVVVSDNSDSSWVITIRPGDMPPGGVLQLFLSPGTTTTFDRNGATIGHGYAWSTSAVVFPSTPPGCTITPDPAPLPR